MKSNLFKIKKGKLNAWLRWGNQLENKYRKEALETLQEEQVQKEAFLFFKIGKEYYTISLVEGEGKPANMEKKVNRIHTANKKKYLEFVSEAKKVYELKI